MPPRKRTRAEVDDRTATPKSATTTAANSPARGVGVGHASLIDQIRNQWEFAALAQYIFSFGRYMKLPDDLDVDVLETECLKPSHESRLFDIGLTLLKFVSSHRGLSHDNFDEYTRRQYLAKAPTRNPFGDDLSVPPTRFHDFDVLQKIRVLHQLSTWTLWNPDRWRERIPEQKELDQTNWRINEFGYDENDRVYYLLDDNRLYRRTDPPIPEDTPATPAPRTRTKSNTKRARALARAAKRRKIAADATASEADHDDDQGSTTEAAAGTTTGSEHADANADANARPQGYAWECVAITLAQYREFLGGLAKTKDPNEQILRDRIEEHIIPVVEKWEESQQRKIAKRERELFNMARMAGAKKSSRLVEKQERERQEREAVEAEKKIQAQQESAAKREKQRAKIEAERQRRLMTRERRKQDREERRNHNQRILDRLNEEAKLLASAGDTNVAGRMSERRVKSEIESRRRELDQFRDDESWVFDCAVCGVHGENLDDGQHSVSCEECNIWQHSQCLGIPKDEAEKPEFHFVCGDCKRRIEEEKRPKIAPLKFRVGPSASPPAASDLEHAGSAAAAAASPSKANRQSFASVSSPTSANKLHKTPISSPVSPAKKTTSRKASLPAYPPAPMAPLNGVSPFQQAYSMAPPPPNSHANSHLAPRTSTTSSSPYPYQSLKAHQSPQKPVHAAYQHPNQSPAGLSPHPQHQIVSPAHQNPPAMGYPQYPPIPNKPESSAVSSHSTPSSASVFTQSVHPTHHQPPQQYSSPRYPTQSPTPSHQSHLSNQTTPRQLSYSQSAPISSGLSPTKHSPRNAPPPPPLSNINSPNNPAVVPPQRLDPSPRTTTFPSLGSGPASSASAPYDSSMPPPLPPPVKHMPDIEERKRRTSGMRIPSSSSSSAQQGQDDFSNGNGNGNGGPVNTGNDSQSLVYPPPLPPSRSFPPPPPPPPPQPTQPFPDDDQRQAQFSAENTSFIPPVTSTFTQPLPHHNHHHHYQQQQPSSAPTPPQPQPQPPQYSAQTHQTGSL